MNQQTRASDSFTLIQTWKEPTCWFNRESAVKGLLFRRTKRHCWHLPYLERTHVVFGKKEVGKVKYESVCESETRKRTYRTPWIRLKWLYLRCQHLPESSRRWFDLFDIFCHFGDMKKQQLQLASCEFRAFRFCITIRFSFNHVYFRHLWGPRVLPNMENVNNVAPFIQTIAFSQLIVDTINR